MRKSDLKRFRKILEAKREAIIFNAAKTMEDGLSLDIDDLPDEINIASSEGMQSFTFRLRGREKSFLEKIDRALKRIDDETFGICEECGERIADKRLEARPETTLCIRCKENQEKVEKDFA